MMNRTIAVAVVATGLLGCSGDDGGGSAETGGTGGGGTGTGGSATGGSSATGGTNPTGGTSGTSGTGGGPACAMGPITAQPANNYTFSSDISVKPLAIRPSSELFFDWSMLTTDFSGHTVSPTADINSVLVVMFSLNVEQFEEHLNADDGTLDDFNVGALQLRPNGTTTSSSLYDFGVIGAPETTYRTSLDVQTTLDENLDPAITDPTMNLMAVMPSTGTSAGQGARMVQVLRVDPSSTTTMVSIGSSMELPAGTDGHTGKTDGPSMTLVFDVDLQALTPTRVPAGRADLTIDWTGMTTNALGRMWQSRSIDEIMIARYTQPLEQLENDFLDLETLAERLYRADVPSDEPFLLTALTDAQGQPFPGIDATGTWVLALSCRMYCANPAPWYLTILAPCN
jgi:hypothetical protein